MTRKHNTPHNRSGSHYKERLLARGLYRTPRMRWTGDTTEKIQSDLKAMREKDDRRT